MEDYDEFDILRSKSLGETLYCCKTKPAVTGELFLKLTEDCGAHLNALVLTFCNAPHRVRSFEAHIAAILLAAQNKDPSKWSTDAVG